MAISGRLTLTFHEGKDLIDKDLGKQDPFCTATIKGEKLKTKTHEKGGRNPTWEQALLFNLKGVDAKECVHIQCWDEDLLSNDKIGRADVPLKYLFESAWEKKDGSWFQLVDFENFKKIAGYVRLSIKWDGEHPSKFGWDVAKPVVAAAPAPAPAPAAAAATPAATPAAPAAHAPAPAPAPAAAAQPQVIVQPPIIVQPQMQQPPQMVYQPAYAGGQPMYQPQPMFQQAPQQVYLQPMMMQQQPVYQQPMMQPVYQQPVYQQPVYPGQPVYQQQPMYQPQPGQPFYRPF